MTRPSRASIVPWPDEAAAAYRAKGYWDGRPLGARLYAAADADPDAVCLVDGERRLSYRELTARADGAATRLRALGLRPGDRVVVQLPNCWEFVVLTVALLRLGVLPVMALTAHRQGEISSVAAVARARALLVPGTVRDFDHQAMALAVAAQVPEVEHVLVLGDDVRDGGVDLRALCEPADDADAARGTLDAIAPDGSAVALFLLSGGTTGMPKLIARTHDDFGYMIRRAVELCGFGPSTVYLAVLPLSHGFPMAGPGVLGTLMSGGRVVIAPSPAPERAFAVIEREGVTATSLVPAAIQRWVEHRETDRGRDLGSLELLQSGGSRLEERLARRIAPTLGCTLQHGYGMSEGLLCYTRLDDPEDVILRTQGRPVSPDDELLVVDEDGRPVAPGEPGELLTRGPYTVRGYYRGGDLNARSFTEDGWYRTGDLVRLRPDGNLLVDGRVKDVINRGGEKIAAEEVEHFARRVDGVRAAAAVAVPDPELGERVCLCVTVHPGRAVRLADVHAVMERAGVARFKFPERLVLVPEMPLTAIGKVDKKALRATVDGALSPSPMP
ncbi:2,3-dihydroxybenzoate-AMP ligase [Actinomadura namibiensis]|uniref:2,3-dihydroxybenzoate-AMP ligase n=1 Tax=Actinomadura namibiensis TaxID=182080 RepID=A0A7W3LRK3_ACTNM|nr:AMP-binding protein [Actinomadura namibiensis]MBA8953041.1 2,3-dihydroxybenzoate-AMP ligase [Actinomadura namibiensis]